MFRCTWSACFVWGVTPNLAHNPKVGGSNPPPQPTPLFGFNGLSQSQNWLGDSKPNFPAQISEILYAQFYARSVFPCPLTIYDR
jgi:hypothetical protein